MGFVGRGTFPELDTVIFTLKLNQLSNPVPSRGAYLILKVTERKEAREKTFDEARTEIETKVHADKAKQILEETIAGLKKTYPVTVDEQVLAKLGQEKPGAKGKPPMAP